MPDKDLVALVAGDLLADHHLYDGVRRPPAAPYVPTQLDLRSGGAGLVAALLRELLPAGSVELLYDDYKQELEKMGPKSFAVWRVQPLRPGDDKEFVWRLSEPLGYGALRSADLLSPRADIKECRPSIVVLDDAGKGFRLQDHMAAWPAVLTEASDATPPPWIVVKMSAPLAQGHLWRTLRERCKDRLIVVVSIEDIRKEEVHVTKAISWEHAALDLAFELRCNPCIHDLLSCRHLVINFGSEGALHFSRPEAGRSQFQLLYDAQHLEGESGAGLEGTAVGFMSCLTCAIVRQYTLLPDAIAKSQAAAKNDPKPIDLWRIEHDLIQDGIRGGLCGMRRLREVGHGNMKAVPGLPFTEICGIIRTTKEAAKVRFELADVPDPDAACLTQDSPWTIVTAAQERPNVEPIPLYGLAGRVARNGLEQFGGVPYLRLAKLFTVDRSEIESLRSLQRLVVDYLRSDREEKPLSVAMFGPPGAGKSFTVKQFANAIYQREFRKEAPILEFNLSQFADPDALVGAFHAVRDQVLKGLTPVAFWDEFDAGEFKWLQSLLAPMQDGKFNEGQVTHPIGKCIFVFAGGTSSDFKHFGPPETDVEKYHAFKLKKGPDFKSRLSGYLDVLGPNPRQCLQPANPGGTPVAAAPTEKLKDDPKDICFPIRRALLIRATFGLKDDERLEMDSGILTALLHLKHYRHGARSLDQIVQQLKTHRDGQAVRRSALPPRELVTMHADYDELRQITNRDLQFRTVGAEMAPRIHEAWQKNKLAKLQAAAPPGQVVNFKWNCDFSLLPIWMQEENVAAAARIPSILHLIGLRVVPLNDPGTESGVDQKLKDYLEYLAEEEHDGWMEHKIRNGWTYGKRDDEKRIHDNLVPYRDLPDDVKQYDRHSVEHFPETVKSAGYKVVVKGAEGSK